MLNEAERRRVLSDIKTMLVEERQSKFRVRRELIRAGHKEAEATELIAQAILEMKEGRRYTEEDAKSESKPGWTRSAEDQEDTWRASSMPQEFGPSAFEKLHMFRSTTALANTASGLIGFSILMSVLSSFSIGADVFDFLLALALLISELSFTYWIYRSAVNIESFNPGSYNNEGKSLVWQTIRKGRGLLEDVWRTSDPEIDVSISVEWQEKEVRAMKRHASIVGVLFVLGIVVFTIAKIPSIYFWRVFFLPVALFSQMYWVYAVSRRQLAKYNSLIEKQLS